MLFRFQQASIGMASKLLVGILALYRMGLVASETNSTKVALPSALGSYRVDVSPAELVDISRQDPYAPSPQPRRLMVSVYSPVPVGAQCEQDATVPYMPASVAAYEDAEFASYGVPNGTFSRPQLTVCHSNPSQSNILRDCKDSFPLVLFSPGLGNPRLRYGAIAQAVASAGYTVITVDHSYDADIVEYPDGTLVRGIINSTTEEEIEKALAVRVADVRFVLDQALTSDDLSVLPPIAGDSNQPRVALFGHSLGGATAGQAMLEDGRFLGGLNMDGSMHGSVVQQGLDRPFLLFGREGHDQINDTSWAGFWLRSRGWKDQITLLNATHGTFTDLPLLAETLGIDQELPPGVLAPLLGTLEGRRALFIIFTYVTAFLDFVLKGAEDSLLRLPSKDFPEVVLTNVSTAT